MVLGATAAGGAAIGSWLWGYNRENYKFDREMRQKNEFKVLEFRNAQSQLWREDIRDIISLTEKKMDAYLIISVLQLDACLGLFTEGRLEPGTPPWLLQFYMMSLSAAFMYLLMSAWFAMHASVVAQCSSVRLLTQFVRLPVPTWQELEGMRTYASSYEGINAAHWMRVPFTRSLAPRTTGPPESAAASSAPNRMSHSDTGIGEKGGGIEQEESSEKPTHADPWGLEAHGEHRGIYELTQQAPELRRHVLLARKAAAQYQCFDAFARVSMTFGTNQFLCAIGYYALGYLAVQDGAPWVAWCVVVVMAGIAVAMVAIDFSLTRCQQFQLQALIVLSMGTAAVCTSLYQIEGGFQREIFNYVLPCCYVANALWLWRALRACGITEQENGALLPMKFRAVLYLDVFGWLVKGDQGKFVDKRQAPKGEHDEQHGAPAVERRQRGKDKGSTPEKRVGFSAPMPAGPSGQIHTAPDNVWEPSSYSPAKEEAEGMPADEDVVSGHDKIQPGRLPAQVFRSATWMLILLWVAGMCLPLSVVRDSLSRPLVADVFVEESADEDAIGSEGMHVTVGEDAGGLPELIPVIDDPNNFPVLPGTPDLVKVAWPSHLSFAPRAMSGSVNGTEIVISDDFNVYYGRMQQPLAQRRLIAAAAMRTGGLRGLAAAGAGSALPTLGAPHSLGGAKLPSAFAPSPAPAAGITNGPLAVSLALSNACPALEGQAIKDIAMFCGGSSDDCRLLALAGRGRMLHECRLSPAPAPGGVQGQMSSRSWAISQDWLRLSQQETVQSIAVNDGCIGQRVNTSDAAGPGFDPRGSGCLIVGTSSGRLVQMREALTNSSMVVPERVMHQRAHPSARGALTFINNRYVVALWSNFGSITAFDAMRGSVVKEWRLPEHAKWLMLTRGGSSLFMLGVRQSGAVELYRFPAPPELILDATAIADVVAAGAGW
mmetsp:Transcript_62890/g.205325  ORF Transcript_62890/g.205325 Transcript_62890/m.205325 type:complete len:940 (-) Transcript_62890:417-3236(-)